MSFMNILVILVMLYILNLLFKFFRRSKYHESEDLEDIAEMNEDMVSKTAELKFQIDQISKRNKQEALAVERKAKGNRFESYCADIFRAKGFEVIARGILLGKKDDGVDLIALREGEVIFIQCKHWKVGSAEIDHNHIRTFYGDCVGLLNECAEYSNLSMRCFFITSAEILGYSAQAYLRDHPNRVEAIVLPFE